MIDTQRHGYEKLDQEDCPLTYRGNNAPEKRDVLGTLFLSILSGHWRYAHMTSIRYDTVNPGLLGMSRVVSEDSVRRAFIPVDEEACAKWLGFHLDRFYGPLLYEPGFVHVNKKERSSMPRQLEFEFMETLEPAKTYEYAVLVTTLEEEIRTVAHHYRDRADVENNFDELKNQWGWGGYTTHDLKRCQILARCIGLIYNWWSLFVRLAIPHKHAEGITSRPLLLHGVAKQSRHGGQTTVTITSTHGKTESVQRILCSLMTFLFHSKANAEQLRSEERWRMILSRAFRYFLRGRSLRPPPLLPERVGYVQKNDASKSRSATSAEGSVSVQLPFLGSNQLPQWVFVLFNESTKRAVVLRYDGDGPPVLLVWNTRDRGRAFLQSLPPDKQAYWRTYAWTLDDLGRWIRNHPELGGIELNPPSWSGDNGELIRRDICESFSPG